MTSEDLARLTPIIESLKARRILATWSMASWPEGNCYVHAFRVRPVGLAETHDSLLIGAPFTEDGLIYRCAIALTRQNHSDAITAAYGLSMETLVKDLASVYASRLQGKDLPIPESITVKELRIQLTTT